jgi:hypothetical protein
MGEWIYRSTFPWPRHYLGASGQLHRHAALPPGIERTVSWVGPTVGLDCMEKEQFLGVPRLEFRPLGRPFHSQSLYVLRNRCSLEALYFPFKSWLCHLFKYTILFCCRTNTDFLRIFKTVKTVTVLSYIRKTISLDRNKLSLFDVNYVSLLQFPICVMMRWM